MNLKLNNDLGSSTKLPMKIDAISRAQIKEERQRTGRYIAILVGILLFLLAIYHAWVRRIPVVASLVVPALIMFIYVGWVLYTASRDKYKNHLLDLEAADHGPDANHEDVLPNGETPKTITPDDPRENCDIAQVIDKEKNTVIIRPIILINDEPPSDTDEVWTNVCVDITSQLKTAPPKRKFKRRFCRTRRYAAFKRSYSIG